MQGLLNVISDELYTKSTHFLLELIQNADDNTYNSRNPTLNFSYKNGGLRVDCNEIGFTPSNVKAICTIKGSTKAGLGHSTRYIGEKGIGFKSVFKVANVVHIFSRNFSFKFDKRQPVGMVAPIWEKFPEKTLRDHTSFYLQLSGDYAEDELVHEIRQLDPRMLIFLRQLKEINLTIARNNEKPWTQSLRRTDKVENGTLFTTLHQESSSWKYVITRHHFEDLPPEPKRPGCSNSEVLIAFPWNCAIRDACVDAFANAVDHLNSGPLKYYWPQYLPVGKVDPFFKPLQEGILKKLADKSVLESCTGKMVTPSSLVHVPLSAYADRSGTPFTMTSRISSKFLSLKYPDWEINALYALGVKRLTPEEFLVDLGSMISNEPTTFQNKSESWHSQLAAALLTLATKKEHRSSLKNMKLIPLRNGEWVSAQERTVFFSSNIKGLEIPSSVQVDIVHPGAEDDLSRRSLFTQLDVKACEASEICQIIVKMHGKSSFKPESLNKDELLSHALFLFKASWQPPENAELWFATTKDERRRGSELYMPGNFKPGSAPARVIKQLEVKFPYIHRDYLHALPEDKRWPVWLCDSLHLCNLPRIATRLSRSSRNKFNLSEEFKYIFQNCQSLDVLQMLREHWDHYSIWIVESSLGDDTVDCCASKEQIRNAIGLMEVGCKGGTAPLRRTVLPALDPAVDENPCVRALSIREPKFHRWEVLRNFGVAVKKDLHYYLQCLEDIQGSSAPKETIAHIYEQIQHEYYSNEQLIWDSFRGLSLIYTRAGSSNTTPTMQWLNTRECIQRGFSIEDEYPQSANLFQFLLATGKDKIGSLIAAASLINASSKLSQISEHFAKISKALIGLSPKKVIRAVQPLQRKPLFPIIKTEEKKAEFDSLCALGKNTSWFVADLDHLRESFRGIVDLLAFKVEDLESMADLLKALNLESRKLSILVKTETGPKGTTHIHRSYTRSLQAKAPFITALISKSNPDRDIIITRMNHVTVSIAQRIVHNYNLTFENSSFTGRSEDGEVAFNATAEHLEIFMTEDAVEEPCPPPELVEIIADHCKIDPTHHALLQTALSQMSLAKLMAIYRKRGIHVPETALEGTSRSIRCFALLASAFAPPDYEPNSSIDGLSSKFKRIAQLGKGGRIRFPDDSNNGEKRKMPFKNTVQSETAKLQNGIGQPDETYTITSRLLQEHLGAVYDPERHWTSPLRRRTGYFVMDVKPTADSSFTIADRPAIQKVTSFLVKLGHVTAASWKTSNPRYHFEVAASPGDTKSGFSWSTAQFERIRKFRMDEKSKDSPKNVLILVRICSVYTNPLFDLFVDPWRLYISDRFVLSPGWSLVASIDEHPPSRASDTGPSARDWAEATPVPAPASLPTFAQPPIYMQPSSTMQNSFYTQPSSFVVPPPIMMHTPFEYQIPFLLPSEMQNQYRWNGPAKATYMKPQLPSYNHEGKSLFNYSYKNLNDGQIRLLGLLPGDEDAILRGVVYHVPLQAAGNYRALSYAWGQPERTHSMWTPDGSIPLTASLHSALKWLRHMEQPLVLWVDAICINQDDSKEKTQQIRLLPRIFLLATSVLAYLGDDTRSDGALETLMQIQAKEALKGTRERWPEELPEIPLSWTGQPIPPASDAIWEAIGAFFDRPWFRRTWIIQEVVAATSVRIICGKWAVDWNDLYHAMEVAYRETTTSEDRWTSIRSTWDPFMTLARHRELEANKRRLPLIDLLESFRYAESTLKRDRFFSLLGFAEDGDNPSFEIDYEAPFADIVRTYACALIKDGKAMQMLRRAGISAQPDRFPSWIPDWTVHKEGSLYALSSRGMKCSAAGPTKANVKCDARSNEIQVSGLRIDEIKSVSKAANLGSQLKAYLEEVDRIVDSLPSYPVRETRADVKWKVPIAGALRPGLVTSADLDMRSSYVALRECLAHATKTKSPINDISNKSQAKASDSLMGKEAHEVLQARAQNYILALQENLCGWRFIVTKGGFVGVAPPSAQEGDVISIFNGGAVPFLIRRSSSVQGAFQLVGECYVHGIMDGDAKKLCKTTECVFRLH
ncbi:hypothetical protein K432DRAFT_463823 [Lepidopterella palustris CBS 459.81]|uniref:Heterokaryon incompatibility domain-containing protein n=1 Tax=Lepidopterella palustris CBS 459.81 TaxID=1314670 RepID=A0A8E2EHK6_9PEZI|nr:hypothetical protein K432DRAFT_463823 [Lepidopterella palustris CBS 459.81]